MGNKWINTLDQTRPSPLSLLSSLSYPAGRPRRAHTLTWHREQYKEEQEGERRSRLHACCTHL